MCLSVSEEGRGCKWGVGGGVGGEGGGSEETLFFNSVSIAHSSQVGNEQNTEVETVYQRAVYEEDYRYHHSRPLWRSPPPSVPASPYEPQAEAPHSCVEHGSPT